MKPTSDIDPHGKLRAMSIKELLRVAKGCHIEHEKKTRADLIGIIEFCLTVHGWGTLFSDNEMSDAAKTEGLILIDPAVAKAQADTGALARFHAMVSDCDHWFLVYSYYIKETEYGFLWETPYDEIHRKYSNVKTWYDDCGSDTYFTIAYSSKDPRVHYPTVKKCKDLVHVRFIGEKKRSQKGG